MNMTRVLDHPLFDGIRESELKALLEMPGNVCAVIKQEISSPCRETPAGRFTYWLKGTPWRRWSVRKASS